MFQSQNAYLFGKGHSLLVDRKFDTAIRASQIEAFLDRHAQQTSTEDDKLLHAHFEHYGFMTTNTTLIPLIMLDILQTARTERTVAQPWSPRLVPLIKENLTLQQNYNRQTNPTLVVPTIGELLDKVDKYTWSVLNWLMLWAEEIAQLVETLPVINTYRTELKTPAARIRHRSSHNTWASRNIDLKCWWNNHMCVVRFQGNTYLQPRPVLLQLHNKICDFISVLITCALQAGTSLEADAVVLLFDFITEFHRMHLLHPTQFFNVTKAVEGYITSLVLLREEEWVNDHLYNNIVADVGASTGMDLRYLPISRVFHECSTPLLMELSCLVKLSGHPLIDMEAGHRKLSNRVQEQFPISIAAVASCISAIKKNYVRNFIVRYKRWPAVTIHPVNGHPALKYAFRTFQDPYCQDVTSKHGVIDDEDWSFVELLPELKFIYAENIIPLLKDKAISVLRTRAFEAYINKEKEMGRMNPKETRLLLFYLFSNPNETNHMDYLMKYMASDDSLDTLLDYLVIRVVPKEKELKTEYRGFGCKTFLDRARSIVQELNAMRYLDLTSDEQAMTLSELQLSKKLYAYRNLRRMYPNHHIIMINFDASGWNNKFRRETVDYVMAHTLDKVHGVDLYGKTHAAYERTLVVIPDPKYTAHWDGQKGGIEGLNQDTWVIVWLAQVKYAFRDIEYLYHLLAKGDDLRACIPIPEHLVNREDVREVVLDLIQRVSDTAREFGHEIKVTESYASEVVFTFSKTMYLGNITMPHSFRQIQKTYGSNNAFLPVLDDYIASSFSNAHSACSATTTVLPCYVTALWWVYYYLRCHPEYKTLAPRHIVSLTLIPSVVGGLPIIYLHNMFVRAESDLLSAFIGLVQYLHQNNYPHADFMIRFLYLPSGDVSKVQLLQDPYSLPIKKPMSATNYLKRVTRGVLRRRIRNMEIKTLFTVYSDDHVDNLLAIMETCPFWPAKVFSAIYSNSPYQLVDELVTQFLTAKSIRDLLIAAKTSGRRAHNILTTALKCDRKLHAWRIRVLSGHCVDFVRDYVLSIKCPAEATQQLRNEMWGKPITTITYPPIQHQITLMPAVLGSLDMYARANHFTLIFDYTSEVFRGRHNDHFREGQYRPFMGQTTRTGNLTPVLRIVDTDPIASKVCSLLMLRDWTNVMLNGNANARSNIHIVIDKMIQTYTATPVEHLHPFTAVRRSGTSTHRLRAHGFRESIVPNTVQNIYTCMQGESNTHTTMRMDPKNLTINFLHVFCYSISMATYDLNYRPFTQCPQHTWIVTTDCTYCNTEIIEPPVIVDEAMAWNYYAPSLAATKLNNPLETILGETLQDFQDRGARYVAHALTHEHLEIAAEALVAEVINKHWSAARRWEQRYQLHHIGPAHLQQAQDISSFGTTIHLSENDIRAVPMAAFVRTLCYTIRDFFEREMRTADPNVITTLMSTMHDSDVPWYGIMSVIEECGFLYQFVQYVAQETQLPAPAGALNRLPSAVRYCGRALYEYAHGLNIRTFTMTVSTLESPLTINRRFQTLILPMLSRQIMLWGEQGMIGEDVFYGDPDEVFGQFVTLVCPELTLEQIQVELAARPMTTLHVLDSRRMTLEDLSCLQTPEHPRHLIAHYWLHLYEVIRDDVRAYINSRITYEDLLDAQQTQITLYTPLTIYIINIAQCVELCRTHPAYEEKRANPVPVGEEGYPPVADIPRCRAHHIRGYCQRIRRIDGMQPVCAQPVTQPLGPALAQRVDNIRFTDVYRTLGSTTTSISKFVDILRILRWPAPPYMPHGAIFCVGEGEGGIASGCLSLFPNCNIIYNSLILNYRIGQVPGIAIMEHPDDPRLMYNTQTEGVSDLRDWQTCCALLAETERQTVLVHCDAELPQGDERASSAMKIWMNVAKMFLYRAAPRALLIIKVFLDLPATIARVLSYLNLAHMWVIRTPVSHPGPEAYIVATVGLPTIGNLATPIYYIRYHSEHMRGVLAIQNAANRGILCHNQNVGDWFNYQCNFIFEWQNRFINYIPTQIHHAVHDALLLRYSLHPATVTYDEFIESLLTSVLAQIRVLYAQLRSTGAELMRHPTERSQTLRHKVVIYERYLKLHVIDYVINTRDYWDPNNWHRGPYLTTEIFHHACGDVWDVTSLPTKWEEDIIYVDAYQISIHNLIRETFKIMLRLIGMQYINCWRL